MKSIDELLGREYDRKHYHCLHFAADAWELLTGDTRLAQIDEQTFRAARVLSLFRGMRRQLGPTESPSIALMEEVGTSDLHIGVCYQRRLLHLNEGGAWFVLMEVAEIQYRNMRFWT
ncbi:Uncharacterised protein [Bordetella ansorpii]|uniref:Uncharacterized protein n=1 Tax=Bordetella ansorpii TaxID=288768 RepID=A0A157RLN3_9BORD|nr:hypothetical protein [Bordetella ansorpii]SAI58902.1 Uncharacterised protein [Bordetella ansorpii]